MYVPFWFFDSDVTASAEFRAETDTVYDTSDETVTETSVYRCDRQGTMRFQCIPVDGSQKMDDTYMESIEPFDYGEMVPFSPAYFAGYLADKYDVDADAAVPRADERLSQSASPCWKRQSTTISAGPLKTASSIKTKGPWNTPWRRSGS